MLCHPINIVGAMLMLVATSHNYGRHAWAVPIGHVHGTHALPAWPCQSHGSTLSRPLALLDNAERAGPPTMPPTLPALEPNTENCKQPSCLPWRRASAPSTDQNCLPPPPRGMTFAPVMPLPRPLPWPPYRPAHHSIKAGRAGTAGSRRAVLPAEQQLQENARYDAKVRVQGTECTMR